MPAGFVQHEKPITTLVRSGPPAFHNVQLLPATPASAWTERARDYFLETLASVRDRHDFVLLGFVVIPEHVHLLISEPNLGSPSDVMKTLKERVSRALWCEERKGPTGQIPLSTTHDSGRAVFTTSMFGA
jgi:hypothetical protein